MPETIVIGLAGSVAGRRRKKKLNKNLVSLLRNTAELRTHALAVAALFFLQVAAKIYEAMNPEGETEEQRKQARQEAEKWLEANRAALKTEDARAEKRRAEGELPATYLDDILKSTRLFTNTLIRQVIACCKQSPRSHEHFAPALLAAAHQYFGEAGPPDLNVRACVFC